MYGQESRVRDPGEESPAHRSAFSAFAFLEDEPPAMTRCCRVSSTTADAYMTWHPL